MTAKEQADEVKREKARDLRYKHGALATMGYDFIREALWDIRSDCDDVYFFIKDDGDNIVAALDGDEEQADEFEAMFAEVSAKCDMLIEAISGHNDDYDPLAKYYDDCTVALLGNRYKLIGFDRWEEDYYGLTSYQKELSISEAGKRLCRYTKAEMLSMIGQCMGIAFAFVDLRQQYDYLKATMDILRGENMSIQQMANEINKTYERAAENNFYDKEYEKLLENVPDRFWVE